MVNLPDSLFYIIYGNWSYATFQGYLAVRPSPERALKLPQTDRDIRIDNDLGLMTHPARVNSAAAGRP